MADGQTGLVVISTAQTSFRIRHRWRHQSHFSISSVVGHRPLQLGLLVPQAEETGSSSGQFLLSNVFHGEVCVSLSQLGRFGGNGSLSVKMPLAFSEG